MLEGIEDYVGDDVKVYYSEACDLWKDRTSGLAQADDRISEAKSSLRGQRCDYRGDGTGFQHRGGTGGRRQQVASGDKKTCCSPVCSVRCLRVTYSGGKPVILVSMTGSAMALEWEDAHCKGNSAGMVSQRGRRKKLSQRRFSENTARRAEASVTFYRTSEELPEFTDYAMKGRTYRYMEKGSALSLRLRTFHTSFEQGKTSADRMEIEAGGQLRIKTSVKIPENLQADRPFRFMSKRFGTIHRTRTRT